MDRINLSYTARLASRQHQSAARGIRVDIALSLCHIFVLQASSWPPQEAIITWPPFFQYNKRLLRQKTGGACLYMPQGGHWLASFEVIPPPSQKLVFPRPKKWKFPTENCCSWSNFIFEYLGVFCPFGEDFVTPFSTLAMIKGSLPTNSTTPD